MMTSNASLFSLPPLFSLPSPSPILAKKPAATRRAYIGHAFTLSFTLICSTLWGTAFFMLMTSLLLSLNHTQSHVKKVENLLTYFRSNCFIFDVVTFELNYSLSMSSITNSLIPPCRRSKLILRVCHANWRKFNRDIARKHTVVSTWRYYMHLNFLHFFPRNKIN